MDEPGQLILVESNTTGTGRLFASAGRALGLRPILLVADPGRYPYIQQDGLDYVATDTADAEVLLATATELAAGAPIAAVLSSSEYFIGAAAALAAKLGLPAADADAIMACRDKTAQRGTLEGQVPQPRFAQCRSADEVTVTTARLGGKVIVKPCLGTGSEGVRACENPVEAAGWARKLLATRTNERGAPVEPRVLVEEQVSGPEYSVELLNGRVCGITAKHLGRRPWFVETGHDFPAPLAQHDRDLLSGVACKAARALGLDQGPAHVELRLTRTGPVLIEVNPRLAGGMIPELIKLATGQDLIMTMVADAARRASHQASRSRHHASIRFLTLPDEGRVTCVSGLDRARAMPGVVNATCDVRPGEVRQVHHSFRDRVGYVLAVRETAQEAAEAAEDGVSAIKITIAKEKHNSGQCSWKRDVS